MLVHRLASRLSTVVTEPLVQNLAPALWHNVCCNKFSTKGPLSGNGMPSGRKRGTTAYTTIVRKRDREISLFGPKDPRTPLPGNVGMDSALRAEEETPPELNMDFLNPLFEDPDVITSELNVERQSRIADQFVFSPYSSELNDMELRLMRANDLFDCMPYPCPELLAADVRELFPSRHFGSRITVITVSLRKSLSQQPDTLIREEVLENFVFMAQTIVNKLLDQGYHAEFVDPIIGRPLSSGCSRASVLELESRYRRLGLELTKVGSCRMVRHHDWGCSQYVGSVFTNAPHNSPELLDWTQETVTV